MCPPSLDKWLLLIAAPLIGVAVFYMRGLYKLVTRFIGPEGTTRIYIAVIIAALLWAVAVLMMAVKDHPRSVIVIYALIAALLIRLSRQWAGAVLLSAAPEHKPVSFDERKPVIIYGAGTIGIQLLRALNETGGYKIVAFIDPNPSLAGQLVHGVKVLRPEKIGKVIADENVKEVLLATPSALARRAQARAQSAGGLSGGGEDAAGAGGDRVRRCPGERPPADRRRGSVGTRSGDAQSRAAGRQRAGQSGDDHRRRRLDRVGADAPAA